MKRTRQLFLSLAFLAVCVYTTAAQGGKAPGGGGVVRPGNRKVEFKSYRLANGLRVVLAPGGPGAAVAVNITFDAGSRRERPGQAGAAGLLQKILLRNLRQAPGGGGQTTGEGARGFFEGVVNQERASYFSEFDAGRLDQMLSAFAGQVRAPDIGQAQVDEQRLAIQAECRQSEDRRFGRIQEPLLELIYGGAAYQYGATCSGPALSRLSPGAAKSFHAAYYVPNNAVVVLVGDFNAREAEKIVGRHFGTLRRRAVPPHANLSARPLPRERRQVLDGRRAVPATYMSAYLTVPSNHPDWYALNILADIIGQGDASRLHRALVATGLASAVPEGVAESRGQSLFRVGAALAQNVSVETAESVIDAELARIGREGVTGAEVDKARAQEREYSDEQLRTALGRASFLARSTLYYDDPNRINTELDRLLAVSAKDVRRVARKYLVKKNRAVVIERPAAPGSR